MLVFNLKLAPTLLCVEPKGLEHDLEPCVLLILPQLLKRVLLGLPLLTCFFTCGAHLGSLASPQGRHGLARAADIVALVLR